MLNLARRQSDEGLDLGLAGAGQGARSLAETEEEVVRLRQLVRLLGHEIANSLAPMKSLLGSTRLLLESTASPRVDRLLATVEERAAHLQSFVGDCVRSSQVAPPRAVPVDWQRLAPRLEVLFPGLEVAGVPMPVACDAVQIEQVLINLLKNAREAGGDELQLRFEPTAAGLRVSVLDRGPGMTDVQIAALARKGFTTKPGGSGIGLALCRAIIERHGGHLGFERRECGGMKIGFTLPR